MLEKIIERGHMIKITLLFLFFSSIWSQTVYVVSELPTLGKPPKPPKVVVVNKHNRTHHNYNRRPRTFYQPERYYNRTNRNKRVVINNSGTIYVQDPPIRHQTEYRKKWYSNAEKVSRRKYRNYNSDPIIDIKLPLIRIQIGE